MKMLMETSILEGDKVKKYEYAEALETDTPSKTPDWTNQ